MAKTGADRISDEADRICQSYGQNIRIVEVTPLDDGYMIEIDVPRTAGKTDNEWRAAIKTISSELQSLQGVKRVVISIAPHP
jgi:hypothetical protein